MFRVFGLDHFDLRDAASVALLEAVMNQVITSHYVSLASITSTFATRPPSRS